METQTLWNPMTQMTGSYIPRLLGALAILVIGWILALVVSKVARKVLEKIMINKRLSDWISAEEKGRPPEIENLVAKGLFYLIMLFVLVAAFQTLGITLITEPINSLLTELFRFVPQIFGALLLAVVAWVVAKVLKMIVLKVMTTAGIDERLGSKVGAEGERLPLSQTMSNVVFWLVLLLFFPAILSTLRLDGLLAPVMGMVNKILAFLPNLFTAAAILLIGWFVARILQRIITSLLEAVGTDALSERIGLAKALGTKKLSSILGLVGYVLVFIPILVASLNALSLDAVTQPVSRMMEMILLALPHIFAATLIIIISFVVAKIVAGLVGSVLEGLGFNTILSKFGISQETVKGDWTPSEIIGKIVLVAIMFFASIEAANQLGFTVISDLFAQFTVLAGHVLLGLAIFAVGLLLANMAAKAIHSTAKTNAQFLATSARIAILVLSGAMALRQMGLANEIINLAFGLILGAIAIAVAIAFGLGGRDIAGRELSEWVRTIKEKKS